MYDYLRLLFAGVLVAGILLGRTTIYSLGISSFPQKIPHFSQRWEKSWESWEKLPNKNKKAPPSPSMKKMLLTKATKVTQIFYLQNGNLIPVLDYLGNCTLQMHYLQYHSHYLE